MRYKTDPAIILLIRSSIRLFLFLRIIFFLFSIYCSFIYFGCVKSQLQHVGSSFPTRDQTQAPCIVSTESQPLNHHESPIFSHLLSKLYTSHPNYVFLLALHSKFKVHLALICRRIQFIISSICTFSLALWLKSNYFIWCFLKGKLRRLWK